jgi:putative transposase
MSRRKHTAEEIVVKLREADVLIGKGQTVDEACRQLGVTNQTYYKWRKEYGGLQVDQAKRLKELEQENGRLRKVVADLVMDNTILKEAARRNW